MKLYDIYKNKETNRLIQIDSFANHVATNDMIIVFVNIENHGNGEIGSCPSFNGYGTEEEIEEKYEILVPQEELRKYNSLKEILALVNKDAINTDTDNTEV